MACSSRRGALRRLTLIAVAATLVPAGCRSGPSGGTEILWDTWGIPHIFAQSEPELFRAYGWAQMESHGDLILRLYGEARGRAAEYWGPSYLPSDRWIWTMGVPQRADRWYRDVNPDFRRNLDAFVDGVNAYARAHPDRIADDVEVVLPVTPQDVMAHFQNTILFTFVTSPDAVNAALRREQAIAAAHDAGNGSNAWAIGPGRSADGHAMLLANPHLPWSDRFLFYEAQLHGPDVNAYGATLVGLPVPGIAFNDDLGWTHTVNAFDGADLYALKLEPGGYAWNGKVRSFDIKTHVLKIRNKDGSFQTDTLTVRSSVHGPVVATRVGVALALRVVGLDRPGLGAEWWDMAKARNLSEFESALREMQLPMFTVIYADRQGHILHFFGGLTPARPAGPWDWSGIVRGDTSATLWTRTLPYDDLPRVLDPASGWLQNTNDPPWTTTFPRALDPDSFPPYLAPRFMSFRSQRSVHLLEADSSISFEEMIRYKHSARMELADRILDDVIPAARRYGSARARHAADVLDAWDRSADADSRGAVLFQDFVRWLGRHYGLRSPFATPWSPDHPLTTPDGLAEPRVVAAGLDSAAADVERTYGALDVPWGDVFRLQRDSLDRPASGGPGDLGIFRVFGFNAEAGDSTHYRAVFGDSYVAAIDFGDTVRARALLSYGNASQPGSPHRTDQLPLLARDSLRPVWRTRAQIEAHLESRETLPPPH